MNSRTKRYTIGLLIEGLEGVYQSRVYRSIAATLELHNANLICFSGGSLHISPLNEFEHQQNALYRLVTSETLDGIIVSSSIGSFVSEREFNTFLEGFSGLPTVSIGLINDSIPSVEIYNTTGITALLSHLFEEHDIRHCGIIRGPVGNIEAEERWQAFKAALGVHKREQDELLGEKAVMQKLSQPLLSAQFTIDTVKEMVSHHSNNGKKADDDVTMLAIRKLGIGKRKSKKNITS